MKEYGFGILTGMIVAFLICYYQCSPKKSIEYVDRIRIDTLFVDRIPDPKVIYKPKKEIFTIIDSVEIVKYLTLLDSVWLYDTMYADIPINRYNDSIIKDDIRLDYEIETLGFLTAFRPIITSKFKCPEFKDKNISIQFGVGNKLDWKVGGGYKGWLIDGQFNKDGNFDQIYLTKQFRF